jgi:predicted aspartyl protease
MFGITAFAQSPFAALGGASYAMSLAESFSLSDVEAVSAAFAGAHDESFAITDDVPSNFNYYVSLLDTGDLSDNYFGVIDTSATTSEAFSLTDAILGAQGTNATTAESFTLTDEATSSAGYAGTTAESFSLVEVLDAGFTFFTTIDESTSITEAVTSFLAAYPQVAEIIALTEITAAQTNFVGYTAETFVLSESLFPRGWIKINDDQSNNWTGIVTNTTTWSPINNTQNPGWVDIDDSQG